MTPPTLATSLQLPNGRRLANRIAKAAMEENLADAAHGPSDGLIALYRRWAQGGAGLLITGNVMVDRRALTGPGGVVLEDDRALPRFRDWARAAHAGGGQVWMQINHPGRQTPAALGQPTVAPSAVPLALGAFSRQFPMPRAMDAADLAELQQRFVATAVLAERAGFDGVQVHAAHGYLVSQFLSPLSNRRDDAWGGPLPHRARLLLDIVRAIRAAVAPGFAVAVKLNSADFQRGGFSPDDAREVVRALDGLGVDLIELSGGSYEAPAMQGVARDGRTLAREAYFLEFAEQIAAVAQSPLMVTGGIRRRAVAEQVLASGVAMVGVATALALEPELPAHWLAGRDPLPVLRGVRWRSKPLAALATMAMVRHQLRRLSEGRSSQPGVAPWRALIADQLRTLRLARRYRRWMRAHDAQDKPASGARG